MARGHGHRLDDPRRTAPGDPARLCRIHRPRRAGAAAGEGRMTPGRPPCGRSGGRVDIAGEFAAAGEALRAKGWDSLAHLGLTREAVEAIGFAGLARVRGLDDGRWRPHPQGTPAVIVPAYAGRIWDDPSTGSGGGWGSALLD